MQKKEEKRTGDTGKRGCNGTWLAKGRKDGGMELRKKTKREVHTPGPSSQNPTSTNIQVYGHFGSKTFWAARHFGSRGILPKCPDTSTALSMCLTDSSAVQLKCLVV